MVWFRSCFFTAVVLLSGCATVPSLVNREHDPSNPEAPEGASEIHSSSLLKGAPEATTTTEGKESEASMPEMKQGEHQ